MSPYSFSKTITYIFAALLIVNCSSSSLTNNRTSENKKIFIQKPDINYSFNLFPKEINLILTDKSTYQQQVSEGFITNYFYYKKNNYFTPKINITNIRLDKENPSCSQEINPSFFTVLIVTEKINEIPNNCNNLIKKIFGIQILTKEAIKFNNSRLSVFEVKKGKKRIIAEFAKKEGKERAIIFEEGNEEELKELTSLWISLNGKVLESKTIQEKKKSQLLPSSLLINESKNRSKKLQKITKKVISNIPRSRQDSDLLFLSTKLPNARNLKPSLEYNYGEKLSVYFIPKWRDKEDYQIKELDLEGVIFIDMPWILGLEESMALPLSVQKNRGFAIGYDSYELFLLASNRKSSEYFGLTGKISFSKSKISRKEILIRVSNGELIPLGY
ncbi:MAG: penicillin-binding protein activator [Gammaproteobacteria bacterium]